MSESIHRQGDLDGCCGLYAVVHAVAHLTHMDNAGVKTMYAGIVKRLRDSVCRSLLADGTTEADLTHIVDCAAAELKIMPPGTNLNHRVIRAHQRKDSIFNLIGVVFNSNVKHACVVGLDFFDNKGRLSGGHWACVTDAKTSTLYFRDGDPNLKLRRYDDHGITYKVQNDFMVDMWLDSPDASAAGPAGASAGAGARS